MYEIGDLIIYGNSGVCRVEEIQTPNFDGDKERKYYVLKPLFQTQTIFAPVDSTKVFTRYIITADEVNSLIDTIPSITAREYGSRAQEIKEHFNQATNSHCCGQLLELTMSIYAKKQNIEDQKRKLGQTDEQYMKRAEEMLYGEFSAALGIEKDAVQDYIAKRVASL